MQTEFYYPLNTQTIEKSVPDTTGVYALYNSKRELIFYGKAQKQTLRKRMLQHLNSSSECLNNASYYSIEVSRKPEKRLEQKLRHYVALHGKQPECNERLEAIALKPVKELCNTGVLTTAFLR